MTNDPIDKEHLPLPSPESPAALDEAILAHARAHAPEKSSSYSLGWAGGLATTAVLFVAVYLGNSVDTTRPSPAPAPVLLEQERAAAGAAAGATGTAAKAETSADFNNLDAMDRAEEEVQAAPLAELAADAAAPRVQKSKDDPRTRLHETLEHLKELVASGKQEQAQQKYLELRMACQQCGLPASLAEALEMVAEDNHSLPNR